MPGSFRARLPRTGLLTFSDDPDVILAQYAVLKRQVPLLYLVLIISALAVMYLFYDLLPGSLVIGVCLSYVVLSIYRFACWTWAFPEPTRIEVQEARNVLRRTTLAVIPICVAYLGFAFVLDGFGGPSERAALAVCVVLTAIGCIFCLIHLPQAARLVQLITMVPFALYHFFHGNDAFALIALNAAIVTSLMLRVSQNVFDGFVEHVTSRAKLTAQQSETERLAAENAKLAMTDALTSMPNRRRFLDRLDKSVEQCVQSGQPFVVGVIDLDRFKPVNDVYGHTVGDQLLIAVGKRLQSLESERLLVARLGGDEFGLVLHDGVEAADALGRLAFDLLTSPFAIDGHEFRLGCSIGFASFPDAGQTASDLFDRADYALYEVKSKNRGGHTFFSNDLEMRRRIETEIETQLQSADLERELSVDLQPIVRIADSSIVGIEALGRWNSASLGAVEPTHFIEAAERLNMMDNITLTLFEKLLTAAHALPSKHGLCFNLSTHDIVTSSTVERLVAAICRHGVDPVRITFEITETALLRDFQMAVHNICRLRALGISIALDDFGTGFSSLSYLNRLPIDKVKIDRSFLRDWNDTGDDKVLTAILAMCRTLELECVVEGVETEDQLRVLTRLGCSVAQGFLFARPMSAHAMHRWLVEGGETAAPRVAERGAPTVSRLFGTRKA